MMKTVLYPGSFDPFTNGHLDLVMRASLLFDQVIVAVAVNSGKNPLFSLEERREQIEEACKQVSNVKVVAIKGLLVDSLDLYKADAVLRGLRAFSDFEYELQMALMNRSLKPTCETIFMMPTVNNCFVSSSQIKEIAKLGGDYSAYVPANVREAIERKLRGDGK
ncbi:MAG: pantetheine-phosphate adenylyltransferase [Lentisphaeria bacterium]|nr:pantetheine-phosphate adenylyltransferase [Lentisphaeria bacterium]